MRRLTRPEHAVEPRVPILAIPAPAAAATPERPFLYVLNLVRTKHIAGAKRGARTKAMAICTQHQFLHVYKVRLPYNDDPYIRS